MARERIEVRDGCLHDSFLGLGHASARFVAVPAQPASAGSESLLLVPTDHTAVATEEVPSIDLSRLYSRYRFEGVPVRDATARISGSENAVDLLAHLLALHFAALAPERAGHAQRAALRVARGGETLVVDRARRALAEAGDRSQEVLGARRLKRGPEGRVLASPA